MTPPDGKAFRRVAVLFENLYYQKILKAILKTSRLGYGLVVTGAEAGSNFEHIYDNKPEGSLFIGRLVDKALLSLRSAQATRMRKDEIRKFVWNEIHNNRLLGRKTRVLDLASGASRYLRELGEEHRERYVESVCVDKDQSSVMLGRSLCREEQVNNLRFVRANIFELRRVRELGMRRGWRANVVIAAGLFMYFNNEKVEEMLRQIHQYLPPGGLVIFTSVEYLEIKKLMRKTMSVSSGEQWVLYQRKPEYWREVLSQVGFGETIIARDPWHLQNVCVARKMGRDGQRSREDDRVWSDSSRTADAGRVTLLDSIGK